MRALLHQIAALVRAYPVFWVLSAGVIAANGFYYAGVIARDREAMDGIKRHYAEARRNLEKNDSGDDLVTRYSEAKASLQTFRKLLPVESDFPVVSKELSDLMEKNHVASHNPIRLKGEGIVDLLLLKYKGTFTVSGTYENLKGLIADIQNSPRLFCIERLAVAGHALTNDPVEMELTLTTYFRGSLLSPLS